MTLFWRIFGSFWLALFILLAVMLSAEQTAERRATTAAQKPAMSTLELQRAIEAYEAHGATAFCQQVAQAHGTDQAFTLLNSAGQILAQTGATDPQWTHFAASAATGTLPRFARIGTWFGMAAPVVSASRKQYVLLVTIKSPLRERYRRPRFWTKLAIAMLPITFVCWALALYITRPLSHLSLTAKRLAEGELSARPPEQQKARTDEIGALSRDMDTMAVRIAELISMQRRFVADVAHELGAPLTRVQLALTLLQRTDPSDQSRGIEQLERDTDRLSSLVQELLYLASLEHAGAAHEHFERLALDELCRQIVVENAAEAEEKGCKVRTEFVPVQVVGSPMIARRAIENVLRNALRYSSHGADILFKLNADADWALIEILDRGPGVPEDSLTKIFQPFVRAKQRAGSDTGSGLGLAIAAEAVALHAGVIEARNRAQGGLSVSIRLPRHRLRNDNSRQNSTKPLPLPHRL